MSGVSNLRSGDDDLGVDKLLVKLGLGALLVRGRHEGVARILEPLADAKLVLGRAQELGDLAGNAGLALRSPQVVISCRIEGILVSEDPECRGISEMDVP